MEFACDRCKKRYSTSYQPVTGRVYRIPCKCGNNIVLRFDLPRNAEPPPPPPRPASRRTPPPLPDRYLSMANGRARAEPTMKAMTVGGCAPDPDVTAPLRTAPLRTAPLQTAPVQTAPSNDGGGRARLDPTASPELSGEYPYEPSTSIPFGVAFALSRRRAFLAGCGAGASGAMVLVGAVALVAWLSGPRSENRVTTASAVNISSKTEQASAPLAAANATLGGDRTAPHVRRRVKQARSVVTQPLYLLVETAAASHPTAVERQVAARAGGDEGRGSPAPVNGSEPKQPAAADDGEASDLVEDQAQTAVEVQAQTAEEHGPALDERAAAATEAPPKADESSDEPHPVALVPEVELEQTDDGRPSP